MNWVIDGGGGSVVAGSTTDEAFPTSQDHLVQVSDNAQGAEMDYHALQEEPNRLLHHVSSYVEEKTWQRRYFAKAQVRMGLRQVCPARHMQGKVDV